MSSVDDTQGLDPDSRPAAEWLEMVRREERRGELLAAYDIANRGLEQHPEDVDLAYRAVLALARTGSTSEAERRFVELHLTDIDTEDVAALWARILKDRALAASGEERRHLAEAAALAYQRIADQNRAYFPAINAATLHLVAGDAGHGEVTGLGGTLPGGGVRGDHATTPPRPGPRPNCCSVTPVRPALSSLLRPDFMTATSARSPRRGANCG